MKKKTKRRGENSIFLEATNLYTSTPTGHFIPSLVKLKFIRKFNKNLKIEYL